MNEQSKIEEIEKRLASLEGLVDCLCITNFMTDHKDGDEESREISIRRINAQARRAKDRHIAHEKHYDLFLQAKEKTEEMLVLEQDYPELKNRYEGLFKGLV